MDVGALLNEIAAGEDTFLELKEVVFKGDQVRFSREEGRAQSVIAEVFVSMVNTEGGVVVFGVNDRREVVGVDEGKRGILEQFVVNVCLHNCEPRIEPALDWLYLPNAEGASVLCLAVTFSESKFYVHSTSDGRYLKRIGSHRTRIPAEQLGRLLANRRLAAPVEERPVFEAGIEAINQKLAVRNEAMHLHATMLGVLLFAERPDSFITGAFIDVAAYPDLLADGN